MIVSCAFTAATLLVFCCCLFLPSNAQASRETDLMICEGWLHVLEANKRLAALDRPDQHEFDIEYDNPVSDSLHKQHKPIETASRNVANQQVRSKHQIGQPWTTKSRRR